ncbi:MAG: flagellar basal body rod protein FlgB [Oxalicibacterium faecigallinarum]|uniref:Flagellar basal body rod protein FlgB n=1 Tax=Oxalicibacterium faecigallinarum TaxID=573741 RepID=A0A8J3F0H4_9BURK|nr:flagellar basal body rod protein FlgB [Oxalicibacterium faecigallinarum]MDQ7969706.1 flagellar basal body rod protein FlgB [Oxalicibacterium faecigallinarum]GGI16312.1 flagellar basal body rod protein FlgB [Oxalicibacterium faecigallinarum]
MGKIDDMMRFHETALSLRAQRQQLLASNIANADTPNFKARDIDFNAALQGAISKAGGTIAASTAGPVAASTASGVSAHEVLRTSTAHMVSTSGRGAIGGAAIKYMTEQQGNIDGNTVDMDVQRNQFTDNAMRYEVSLTMASSKIKGLMSAIQGQ